MKFAPEVTPSRGSAFEVATRLPGRLCLALILSACLCTNVFPADKFSVVLVPDPQNYTSQRSYQLFQAQSRWIRDTHLLHNTKFAIYLGDLTNSATDVQFGVVDESLDILDAVGFPYALFPGNHDYEGQKWNRTLTRFNQVVGPQRYAGKSWYGGSMTAGRNENNYCYFSSGGLNFLVVSLEFAPRKETVTWANQLIALHPNHRVIIGTHAYLNTGGSYSTSSGTNYGVVGCRGNDLFDECARRHSNVFMVVCGHVGESQVNTLTGASGNRVYELVVDYQFEKALGLSSNSSLGNGWLRLLTFDPDRNTIDAMTTTVASGDTRFFVNGIDQFYLTNYNPSPIHRDHKFSLQYEMTASLPPYTYLNPSTDFHAFSVARANSGEQVNPDIAEAANGDWVSVFEDDHDNNSKRRIMARGFDYDGNQRFPDTIVNSLGTNTTDATSASIAMLPDGRFIVAFQSTDKAIMARTFSALGAADAPEQSVVSTMTGTVRNPDVDVDQNGNFIVVWEDDTDGNGVFQIKARGFRFDQSERSAARTINSVAAGQQTNPKIAMTPGGDYVISWDDDQDGDAMREVAVRGFFANDTVRFPQMFANATTDGQQRDGDIAIDDSGRFVVVWEDDADLNYVGQIRARGFAADGSQIIPETDVNVVSAGNQVSPAVTMDSAGNWHVVWEDPRTGEGSQIMMNTFSSSGVRMYPADVQVNIASTVSSKVGTPRRKDPAISVHESGRTIGVWADDMDGNQSFDVLARAVTGTACSLVVKAINGTVAQMPTAVLYKNGSSVTLSATPNSGYKFVRWEGNVPSGQTLSQQLSLTMDANKSVTAVFEPITSNVQDWQTY